MVKVFFQMSSLTIFIYMPRTILETSVKDSIKNRPGSKFYNTRSGSGFVPDFLPTILRKTFIFFSIIKEI